MGRKEALPLFPSGAPAKKGKKEEMAAAAEVSPFIYYLPSFAGLQVPPSPPPPQALFTHSARGRGRGKGEGTKNPTSHISAASTEETKEMCA